MFIHEQIWLLWIRGFNLHDLKFKSNHCLATNVHRTGYPANRGVAMSHVHPHYMWVWLSCMLIHTEEGGGGKWSSFTPPPPNHRYQFHPNKMQNVDLSIGEECSNLGQVKASSIIKCKFSILSKLGYTMFSERNVWSGIGGSPMVCTHPEHAQALKYVGIACRMHYHPYWPPAMPLGTEIQGISAYMLQWTPRIPYQKSPTGV